MIRLERAEQTDIGLSLVDVLKRNQREVVDAWIEGKLQLAIAKDSSGSLEQLRTATERQFATVIEMLILGTESARSVFDKGVCHCYLQADPGAVIEACFALKDAALPVLRREFSNNDSLFWPALSQLEECLRRIAGQHVHYYAVENERNSQIEQVRNAVVPEIAFLASRSFEVKDVLRGVAEGIAKAAGVNYCGFFLVDEEQGTVHPQLHLTVESVQIASARLGVSQPRPEPIATFSAFLGQVVDEKIPLTCYDVQVDPRFENTPPRLLGFRSILGLPFVVKGRVVAVAYALTVDECHTFTEEQIDLAMVIANTAGLAIENARLHQQVHSLAAWEERERLARELHDNLSQILGILKLKTSVVSDLLAVQQIDRAQANLDEMKAIATEAYTDTREAIFALRMPLATGPRFLPSLCKYLAGYRESYGVNVRMSADHEAAARLDTRVVSQVIRIIQEALTNVRKHAQVTEAWVHIEAEGDGVSIRVEDEGVGFDPVQVGTVELHHFGLDVIRERAESVGGWLAIDSQRNLGTRIQAWVPFSSNCEK